MLCFVTECFPSPFLSCFTKRYLHTSLTLDIFLTSMLNLMNYRIGFERFFSWVILSWNCPRSANNYLQIRTDGFAKIRLSGN